ncbi:polymorphic toxin-type HINT domain-containing protein [Streptomyces triticisoli]|uniref:polymorphic toxin-type HINT domain-containing protein n=1 Tax=Streptomyces triticisoli TaxID=2182797 RepID=UPI000DD8486E|nr:polymorphic toxin-type HINT domain-containing protein [Streptomyces triticisoli]
MNGRSSKRFRTLRRRVALASAAVMVGTLLQGVVQPAAVADEGKGRSALPRSEKPVPGSPVKAKPRTLMKGPRTPQAPPDAAWPKADTAVVELPASAAKGTARTAVRAKGLPLTLDTGDITAAKSASGAVEARVLGREAAKQADVDGLLFTLRSKGEGKDGLTGRAGRVRAKLDYSGFAEAYGGGYASRLTLVELPACALTTPDKARCRTSVPVASVNDTEKQTLTAQNVTLSASAPTVLAAVAEASSENGDYTATSLSPSATWNTNLNTGDFAWSYDMPVPDVPGSLTPNIGLSYSSSSIDGRTGSTNNQASWAGDGFDFWPGFIERRYKPCADDGVKNADGNKPGDLCWAYDNAFITFNGKGGELVPNGTNSWKLKDDDGTRIDRLTSSNRGNGDNDGEYWRLTDPDGTRYYFGYHRLPGWADGKPVTNSTWTVPVFGNDTGEPCHASAFADAWCQQAWRWNLDYAVDVHGNAIAYYYNQETNSYGRNLKAKDNTRYVRGGTLDRVEYGLKSSSMYGTKALAKVDFTDAERCLPNSSTTCTDIGKDAAYWYDTPWDLNCDAGKDCDKGRLSPVFFTRKRITEVSTQVWDGSAYQNVDSWKLTHRWGMADTDYQLLLDSVQRTGHTETPAITLPKTTFAYTQLANRLDKTGDGYPPFIKDRLSTVADESGGQIDVNYSAPACDFGALPTPQTNTTRCFPQYIGGSTSDDPERQWFNKYVVTSVTATDRTGGAPDEVTTYQYLGGAAWHYDDDDGLTKEKFKTWSQWRGYGQVRVQAGGQGGASAMKSQEDTYFLRGMDGDRKDTSGGTKTVTVTLGEGEGDPITDHELAAGFAYKTVSYSGPGGKVLAKEVSRPWHHQTAKKTRSWGTVTANFTGTKSTRSWTSLDDGAGAKWRTTETSNEFDTVAGRVTQVDDRGDISTAADDTCTRTTYATNTTDNLLTLPSRVETVSKACGATVSRPADVMSDVRTAYDGGAYDAAPTKGDETASAVLKQYDGTTAVYLESGTTYDAYGRALTSTDLTADVTVTGTGVLTRTPRGDGRTTTTELTPATGFATTVKVTTPPVKAGDAATKQTSITSLEILRGLPVKQTDTNNNAVDFAYDALGRSTKVWLADRLTGQTPTYQFTYTVTEGKPVAVGTKTLGNNAAQRTSYTLYDGFLRPRQTQDPGPDGGRLLADTFYDERGLTAKEFATYYATGAPSTTLSKPDDALSVQTQNWYTYDGLGRQTEAKQIAGNGDGGTVLGVTRTIYGGDRTTVIPPVGGTATTILTDARDRTTELRQHHARIAEASYDTTKYAYTPRGELSKATDPAGNTWSYTYDLLGRQLTSNDPDKGTTTSTYDDRGQLVTTKDARPGTPALWHGYDNLGRKTELREGSATGKLRATWTYDTVSGAKGHLAESTRYVDGAAYTTKVTLYDRLYRPVRTAVVVPEREDDLQGTYQAGTSYLPSGLVGGVSYSAAGSLPGGSQSFTYDPATLRPISLLGDGFKAETSYFKTGQPSGYKMYGTAAGAKQVQVTNTYEWGTQRLANTRVERQDVAGVDQSSTYRYDEVGNVLSVSDVSRAGTDTQCFTYDHLRRMSEAWTQNTTGCAATPGGSILGGPAPYWHSYTYDKASNRATQTLHDTTGDTAKDTTRTYSYPGVGKAQPHTLTSVTTTGPTGTAKDSFGYDETGNTTARTLSGTTQTLEWDAEGHLAKVTEPVEGGSSKVTEYLYDTEGNRLIGRTPTETTLYLGTTEITLAKGSTTPKATRYYDLGGGHQAVKADDGSVSFTLADHHGTAQLAIEAATQKLTQRRNLPFGSTRGTEPDTWPGTKGFVGGTNDTATTGLTHLGAREYDPVLGRFISVDPILSLDQPQSLNGYTYANNNPTTASDPDGLESCYGVAYCSGSNGTYGTYKPKNKSKDKDNGKGKSPVKTKNSGKITNLGNGAAPALNKNLGKKYLGGSGRPTVGQMQTLGTYMPNVSLELNYELYFRERCGFSQGTDMTCKNLRDYYGGWKHVKDIPAVDTCPICGNVGFLAVLEFALKRGGGCNSFLPEQGVRMADGSIKSIDEVEVGDKVLATDPKTGKTEACAVTATIIGKGVKNLVKITLDLDGKSDAKATSITATVGHPFWVPELGEWIKAGDLREGQWLRTSAGAHVQIAAIKRWTQHATVRNLTVEGIHTYYVLAGETPVLVHNSNGWCGPGFRTTSEAGISPNDARRIQNAADKSGYPIVVVGSRAGGTAHAMSDWDYILYGPAKSRNRIKNSLPRGTGDGEGSGRGRDFWQGYNPNHKKSYTELDRDLPYVVFEPRKR